jgi:dihydroorotate dehydrogenase (fumarate)
LFTQDADYIENYPIAQHRQYLNLITEAKAKQVLPLCQRELYFIGQLDPFAKSIQQAGADAIELNILYRHPFYKSADDNEKVYFNIISEVKKQVSIPISLKISHYFSSLGQMVQKLSWTGISGIVLFNRFYSPDIDVENLKVTSSHIYSTPEEMALSLKWIAMLSGHVETDFCSSTGVHDATGAIKQLLAGFVRHERAHH